jgi:predicted ABC-type ATPase
MSGDYFREGFQALPAHFTFFSRVGRLKKIIIIAGPNGDGKTTFARDFLPSEAHTLRFINADLIAAGLAPFNPESAAFKAGRLMLHEIDECVAAGHDLAVARVAQRVMQGGHNIPEDVIRRRFKAGLKNFNQHYRYAVDSWMLYDNSGMTPKLLDWSDK